MASQGSGFWGFWAYGLGVRDFVTVLGAREGGLYSSEEGLRFRFGDLTWALRVFCRVYCLVLSREWGNGLWGLLLGMIQGRL